MRFSIYLLSSLLGLGMMTGLQAQETPADSLPRQQSWLRLNYQAGSVLQTNKFLAGENASGEVIDAFQAGSIELGWQTNGSKLWEQLWSYPHYGVGFYTANFFNKQELGVPSALYGFFGGPFKRWRKVSLLYEIGLGLTYNWNPYHPDTNPFQVTIGSYRTVYVDFGAKALFVLSPRLEGEFGVTFSHFSNGALAVPNFGMNMFAPKIGLRYNLRKEKPEFRSVETIPVYEKNWEQYVRVAAGSKQIEFDTTDTNLKTKYLGINYGVFSLNYGLLRQISHKVKFGGGVNFAYDGSTAARIEVAEGGLTEVQVPFAERLSLSVFGSMELVVNRTALAIQPGFILLRKEVPGNQKPRFFQRVGLRHHLFKDQRMFIGIYLRATEFSKADYIEWAVGFRFNKPKSYD